MPKHWNLKKNGLVPPAGSWSRNTDVIGDRQRQIKFKNGMEIGIVQYLEGQGDLESRLITGIFRVTI